MTNHTDRHRPHTATRSGLTWASATARTGWTVLLVISIIGVLNHLVGVWTVAEDGEEQLTFALFAAVNASATAVLLRPYRRHETWAWLVTWVQVAAFASVLPLTGGGGVGLGYLVVAAVCGLAQLATLPDFRSRPTHRPHEDRVPART